MGTGDGCPPLPTRDIKRRGCPNASGHLALRPPAYFAGRLKLAVRNRLHCFLDHDHRSSSIEVKSKERSHEPGIAWFDNPLVPQPVLTSGRFWKMIDRDRSVVYSR